LPLDALTASSCFASYGEAGGQQGSHDLHLCLVIPRGRTHLGSRLGCFGPCLGSLCPRLGRLSLGLGCLGLGFGGLSLDLGSVCPVLGALGAVLVGHQPSLQHLTRHRQGRGSAGVALTLRSPPTLTFDFFCCPWSTFLSRCPECSSCTCHRKTSGIQDGMTLTATVEAGLTSGSCTLGTGGRRMPVGPQLLALR
jgi:hypothetical protein